MSPRGSRHAACIKRLSRYFNLTVGDAALVSMQDPVQLNDFTAAQPDVALLHLRDDYYESAHPKPQDVILVIQAQTIPSFSTSADTILG
jgi:hypothetical protein